MKEAQQPSTIQMNLAKIQRNAGGDYYEYFIPNNVKVVLATTLKAELDEMARDNERLFQYRFGFFATPAVREQVIDFQNRYDLLDNEIRWLKRTGNLRITRKEMAVDASPIMPIAGWVQLVLISLLFLAMFLMVTFSNASGWKQGLGQIVLAGMWSAIATFYFKLYIAPWRTLRQSGVIDAVAKESGCQT